MLVELEESTLTILGSDRLLTVEVGVLDRIVLMCSQVGCHGWTWRCRLRLLLMGTTHIRKLRRILVQCHIGKLALLLRLHRLRCLGLLWVVRLVS